MNPKSSVRNFCLLLAAHVTCLTSHGISLVGVPSNLNLFCADPVPAPAHVTFTGACSSNEVAIPELSTGLVLHYSFDRNDGAVVLDVSGNHRTGTVNGATWVANGIRGGAVRFDHTNQFITASDDGLPAGNSARTFAMWVHLDTDYPDHSTEYFSYGTRTQNQLSSLGCDWRSNRDKFSFSQWGGVFLSAQMMDQTGKWYHVVYTYNGAGQHAFYIDGVPSSGASELFGGLNTVLGGVLQLGGHPMNAGSLGPQGYMDEVMIFNRAVSGEEARALYARETPVVVFDESSVGDCPRIITRTWAVTDLCGQSATATQTITASQLPQLALSGVPNDLTVECGSSIPDPAHVTAESMCSSGGVVSCEGLILHYQFDDEQNLGKDSSSHGLHGIVSGVEYSAYGSQGGAGWFDGQGQKISVTNLPQPGYNLSWGAWIVPEGNALFGVMGKTVSGNESFYLHVRPGEKLAQAYVVPASRTEERYARNFGTIHTGMWQHVMGTYDGNVVRLYLDGQLVHSNDYANRQMVRSNNVVFAVGDAGVGMGWSFKGLIDDVRVYARTLSPSAVASLAGVNNNAMEVVFAETSSTGNCPRVITRVWTAEDACGNRASATQTITVLAPQPVEPPTLVGVPGDVTVTCGNIPAPANVTASGECGSLPSGDLIMHYTFDDANDIAFDSSSIQQHGTPSGVTFDANGFTGGAAVFNGTSEISVANLSGVEGSTELTWGAWVKPESGTTGLYGIMGKTVSFDESFYLVVDSRINKTRSYVVPPSQSEERFAEKQVVIHPGIWTHIMGTYAGNTIRLYINGELSDVQTFETVEPIRFSQATFAIGDAASGRGWKFKGGLDDLRMYSRTLNADEIHQVYVNSGNSVDVVMTETVEGSCPGVIKRIWTASDSCGNSSSATQTITVLSPPPPDVDTDGDGLLDGTEKTIGTNPNNPDTDGDGRSDGIEVQMGTNPLVFNAFPYFVRNDFDGDLISDIGVYAHASGAWHILRSRAGYQLTPYGFFGTTPVPGDYDGDKKADIAVFDPANYVWYILGSGGKSSVVQWGFRGTVPVPADYDGDGRTDIAVYHARLGLFYVNGTKRGTFYKRVFLPGGQPVVGDFDGDRAVDFAVYQPSAAKWKVVFQSGGSKTFSFGDKNSKGVAGDYDADGRADFTTFNPANGQWNILGSTSGSRKIAMPEAIGGQPVTGYYYARSGNNRVDPAVYLPFSGEWLIWGGDGIIMRTQFGDQSSTPLGAGP